jgi:hypothetical protein
MLPEATVPVPPLARLGEVARLTGLAKVEEAAGLEAFAAGKWPCSNQAWKRRGSFFILVICSAAEVADEVPLKFPV